MNVGVDVMSKNRILYAEKIAEAVSFLKMSGNKELIEHSDEVAQIARMILKDTKSFNLLQDEKMQTALKYMNLDTLADLYELHDLGKIFIPDEILNKPGRLTDQEFKYVRRHPENTKKILDHIFPDKQSEPIQILYDTIMVISREHHENYDGTGYPRHLKGNEISTLGRIARVADVISALMGHRCYNREFNSFEAIANYLVKNKGVLFDPAIVDIVTDSKESNKNIVTKENLLNVFDIQNEINRIIAKKISNRGR